MDISDKFYDFIEDQFRANRLMERRNLQGVKDITFEAFNSDVSRMSREIWSVLDDPPILGVVYKARGIYIIRKDKGRNLNRITMEFSKNIPKKKFSMLVRYFFDRKIPARIRFNGGRVEYTTKDSYYALRGF